MKTSIETFEDFSGWSAGAGAVLYRVNDHKDYIADNLLSSLIFSFGASGDYVEKTFSIPVTLGKNDRLTLSLWSWSKGTNDYKKYTDFVYKIELGTGKEYYLPVPDLFTDVQLDVSDIATIEKIKITYLGDELDYLIVSAAVISRDEIPLDIFNPLKEAFEEYRDAIYDTSYLCGRIRQAEPGDVSIEFENPPVYLKRYSKIKIADGVNTEHHHIESVDGTTVKFTSYYDGDKIINQFLDDTPVYLIIACEFGRDESQIVLPSINIWGISPERLDVESDVQEELDTWKTDGSVNERETGEWFQYSLLIDCEAGGNEELLNVASDIVKKVLTRHFLWVNGKKCTVWQTGEPTNVPVMDVVNNLPKLQYVCKIDVKEEVWDKVRLPATTEVNFTSQIYIADF